jgi:DNA-binding MarR family transcriptional regulator
MSTVREQVDRDFPASIGSFVGILYSNYALLLQRRLRQRGLSKHIRPGVGPLLFLLFGKEGITIREASESLALPFTTVASIVRRMQGRGLLRVERSREDGRQVSLRLTAKAHTLRDECYALGREVNAELLDGLTDQQMVQAVSALRHLNDRAIRLRKGSVDGQSRAAR